MPLTEFRHLLYLVAQQRIHRRSHFAYIGSTGRGNFGDDVMFDVVKMLLGQPSFALRRSKSERFIARLGMLGPDTFDYAVLGGGTLINSDYLPAVQNCLDRGLPMIALGTGVGSAGFSMLDESPDEAWVEVLGRFNAVGVRGPLSQKKLAEAGFDSAVVVGDLALANTPPKPIAGWTTKHFILNCAPARSDHDSALMEKVECAMGHVVRELVHAGWTPIPVAFDPSDRTPTARVLNRAELRVSPALMPRSFADYSDIAARSSFSLGVRLHSAVLAAACGLAPIVIGYRDKCRDFADSLDAGQMVVSLHEVEPAALMVAVSKAIDEREEFGRALHERCAQLREKLFSFTRGTTGPDKRPRISVE